MLNETQELAANTLDGQILLISCPGSGKTTVIIQRVINMLLKGISPCNILVLTFTKNAALQMEKRFKQSNKNDSVFFGTIHSLCFRVLKRKYGYGSNHILSDAEKWYFFQELVSEQDPKEDIDEYIKLISNEISFVKNSEVDIYEYTPAEIKKNEFIRYYNAYEEYKLSVRKFDFDDMIILCRDLLKKDKESLDFWKKAFPYLLVDEYQDSNSIQLEIFYLLTGNNGNIFAVGDDDQSIYRFRGANIKVFSQFEKNYPTAQIIKMTTNYRSEPQIIKMADNLISHNEMRYKKDFFVAKKGAGSVRFRKYDSSSSQTKEIVIELKQSFLANKESLNETTVLYRNNMQNLILVGKLIKEKLPFFTTEKTKDIHNEFIYGDIMAFYRLANGVSEKGDLQRIQNKPNRYLKKDLFVNCPFVISEMVKRAENLSSSQESRVKNEIFKLVQSIRLLKGLSPRALIKTISDTLEYKEWLLDYAKFRDKDVNQYYDILDLLLEEASDFERMEDWMQYVSVYKSELIKMQKNKAPEGVCLSTFHSAKGLEWDNVYIIDMNEGVSPSKRAATKEDFEEERRLFYVAITRARNNLTISSLTTSEDSRFLSQLRKAEDVKYESNIRH